MGSDAVQNVLDHAAAQPVDFHQKLFLVLEIVVESGLGDVEPFGDIVERCAGVALFQEQLRGGLEDGFALGFWIAAAAGECQFVRRGSDGVSGHGDVAAAPERGGNDYILPAGNLKRKRRKGRDRGEDWTQRRRGAEGKREQNRVRRRRGNRGEWRNGAGRHETPPQRRGRAYVWRSRRWRRRRRS